MLVVREQAFRLRANAPRGKRVLRGKRGGKVSKSLDSLTHRKVSTHALSPLVPLVPHVPLSDSWRSERAQSIEKLEKLGRRYRHLSLSSLHSLNSLNFLIKLLPSQHAANFLSEGA